MGLLSRIFGGSVKPLEYPPQLAAAVDQAMHHLHALTAGHDGGWGLGQSQWSVDQDDGTIVFTTPKGLIATAPVQIVGTYNTDDHTWLWGWDHPSVAAPLAEHAKKVYAYGREHGYEVLTTRKLQCTEKQGWDFTALACRLADAQGGYRGPMGGTRIYMTFGNVKLRRAN